jgi:multicomponent Na+:H+ antiporter subunit D
VCGIIGALAISSFPLTSGFVSKSMVTQAFVDEHLLWVWLLLQAASAGVFLHAGIKFPWFVFFQKDSGLRPDDPPVNMQMGMIFFAVICILLGVFPSLLYSMLPYEVNYVPYTAAHTVTQLQLLLFSGLAFFVMLPLMKRTLTISLDFDWFYRKFGKMISIWSLANLCLLQSAISQKYSGLKLGHYLDNKLNIRFSLAMGMSLIMVVFIISLSYFLL